MSVETLQAGPAAESGNGVVLDVCRRRDTCVVRFLSEARTSPQPLWFHLECTGAAEGARLEFRWENAGACLGLHSPDLLAHVRPVVRRDEGPWQRVGPVRVRRLPHGEHGVSFETPAGRRRTCAAFCYPYGPADLAATLHEIGRPWRRTVLCPTAAGNPLPRLAAAPDRRTGRAPSAYFLARQHAGETPGSWVLDGLLRAVSAERRGGPLRRVAWHVVPFADLDGVVQGNYGKDSQPVDFNRSWNAVPMRHEVLAIQRDAGRVVASAGPCLLVDLHAPAGGERQFYQFVAHPGRPAEQREAQRSVLRALARQFPGVEPDALRRENGYQARAETRWDGNHTVTNWAWDRLGGTPAVTIETTYLCLADGHYLEPADYRQLGGKVAVAIAEWLLAGGPAG
ncbi:MAG: hypothetical protein GXY85_02860 [Candidatus Brocadiaceae bacterium]|nr:hypothetical protein [Candidatus Brocadiaceae bacterium]